MEKTIQQIADEITALFGIEPTSSRYSWEYQIGGESRVLLVEDSYTFYLVDAFPINKRILDSAPYKKIIVVPLL